MRAEHLTALALAATVVGCQASDDTNGAKDPVGPTPSSPSLEVTRFVDRGGGFLVHVIPDLGITFTIGLLTPIADLPECGGSAEVVSDAFLMSQEVSTPAGPVKQMNRIRGTLVLYDAVLESDDDFCNLPAALVGQGASTFITNDNDLFAVGPGANSFGQRLTALLDLASGGRARLQINFRAIIGQDGAVRIIVDQFGLTPIGN